MIGQSHSLTSMSSKEAVSKIRKGIQREYHFTVVTARTNASIKFKS